MTSERVVPGDVAHDGADRPTHDAVRRAVQDSYGRLVALLAARTGDVALAEDALSDALVAALERWPQDGVPREPEAWLLAVSRRRLADRARHDAVRARAEPLLEEAGALLGGGADGGTFADRRVDLLFACANPAIDEAARTPLMLQAVLGLEAATIADAYLVAPSAMAQRLVRAKRRLREANVAFRVPDTDELAPRLAAVLDALYAAFGTAWLWIDGSAPGGREGRRDLRDEAIHLARILHEALPEEPEAAGLLALFLYCRARDEARRTVGGAYVPLAEQSASAWDHARIGEAESLLTRAAALGRPGRYQLEAAIQSAHLAVAFGRPSDAIAIARLYDALVLVAPTVAAVVNRAAAHARAFGMSHGLRLVEAIDAGAVRDYQPYWALRAHCLAALGRGDEARAARARAIGLTEDPAVRAWLLTAGG